MFVNHLYDATHVCWHREALLGANIPNKTSVQFPNPLFSHERETLAEMLRTHVLEKERKYLEENEELFSIPNTINTVPY